MSHTVTVSPGSIMTFPFVKTGGNHPTRVTFTVIDRNESVLQEWSYVVSLPDDPTPHGAVPYVFNDSDEDRLVVIKVESSVTGIEYQVGKLQRYNKRIGVIGFGIGDNDDHILDVFACEMNERAALCPPRWLIERGSPARRTLQPAA